MTQEPFWNPLRVSVRASCAVRPEVVPLPGCCEFVGDVVDATCEGRLCVDRSFCPKSIFSDAKVFASCPVRLEKLKGKET